MDTAVGVRFAVALFSGLLWGAAPSLAQGQTSEVAPVPTLERATEGDTPPDAARKRAVELFEQSAADYRIGDFRSAVMRLKEAYLTFPEPVLLFNLGRAYEGAGDDEHAIDAYEKYLAAEPELPDRLALEQRLSALQERVRQRQLSKQPGSAAPAPSRAPAVPARSVEHSERTALRTRALSPLPWLVAGVGVVAIAGGAALWLVAQDRHHQAQREPDATTSETLQRQAKSFAVGANAGVIAGIVIAGAGVTWGVVALRSSRETGAARIVIDVGPGFAEVGGQF